MAVIPSQNRIIDSSNFISVGDCHEDYYNKCAGNQDCCSGNCFRGEDNTWLNGVCKPSVSISTARPTTPSSSKSLICNDNWTNNCHSNQECCSGICFMGESKNWLDGVCHPANATIIDHCLALWSNKCTSSVDCCTGFCEKGPNSEWLIGVCKSREVQGSKQRSSGKKLHCCTH